MAKHRAPEKPATRAASAAKVAGKAAAHGTAFTASGLVPILVFEAARPTWETALHVAVHFLAAII